MTTALALQCAREGCERPWIRERDGQRFCLFHPDQEPPTADDVARSVTEYYKARTRANALARRKQVREDLELQRLDDGRVEADETTTWLGEPIAASPTSSHMKDPVDDDVLEQGDAVRQPAADIDRDGVDSHDVEPSTPETGSASEEGPAVEPAGRGTPHDGMKASPAAGVTCESTPWGDPETGMSLGEALERLRAAANLTASYVVEDEPTPTAAEPVDGRVRRLFRRRPR